MDTFSALILGLVQGLTEFLPVSSSSHLILAREILGLQTENGLTVDAILQLATILAVGIYFYKDLIDLAKAAVFLILRKPIDPKNKTLLIAIILGTIPALIAGLLLEKTMETVFRSAELVAITLILGSILFLVAEKYAKQNKPLSINNGFLIGLFQTLALVPGVSRSGSTISGGLILGLTREQAARFSFLLSFPIILGSGLKKLIDLRHEQSANIINFPLLLSFITAFAVGLICIHFLLRYLKNHTLNIFIIYRLALAAIVLLFIISK
ncbi:MAG TPA: undecaprenyl-diphosphatase UppP [Patescibacteria group bacterium]|nr:undecaprenyl-diphosphatase UppP [Patescibacteria group bacterium]